MTSISNKKHTSPCYDLHTHTTASDGMLTPHELVLRAVQQQVNVLAITDHDTIAGLAEAKTTCQQYNLPLMLISGIEISTVWQQTEIHVVGLKINENSTELHDFLTIQLQKRNVRAEKIAQQLNDYFAEKETLEKVQHLAGRSVITRQHFARYLLEKKVAISLPAVFKQYLSKGKIGYVSPTWHNLASTIDVIHNAGGLAVLAHPGRYALSAKWLRCLIADFKQMGGDAIEVAYCKQSPDERLQLAKYSEEYRLLASQGSDFHQVGNWTELGQALSLPINCSPIWQNDAFASKNFQ